MSAILFRTAHKKDVPSIWKLLQDAIYRRGIEGSNQWQDGYPNLDILEKDVENEHGFVLTHNEQIVGYIALLINDEPEYQRLEGQWKTNGDFVVFHRLAVSQQFLGKGLAKRLFLEVERFAFSRNIYSIKADTNHDNKPMLHLFDARGYIRCGRVYFRGSPREAYEKVLEK